MSTISTSGIAPFSEIKSEHLLRIINALSGLTPNMEIIISGSISSSGFYGTLYGTASNAVYSVNGSTPQPNGNVAVSLTTTLTGDSSSLVAYNTSSLDNGVLWIITNDPSSSYNGNIYVFLSGSQEWVFLPSTSQNSNDMRYVQLSQTSSLNVSSSVVAATASYYNEIDPLFTSKSSSLATTGSNIFVGNQTTTGSVTISGSVLVTGSMIVNGNLTTNNFSNAGNFSAVNGSIIFDGAGFNGVNNIGGSTNIFSNTSQGITFSRGSYVTSSQELMKITLSGSVGIGTSNPTETLEISGSGKFTNGLKITGSLYSNEIVLSPSSSLPISPQTGSLAVSGSGSDCKLYFYNGSWNALF